MQDDAELREAISAILQREWQQTPHTLEKLKGGRNSQVFRADCRDGSSFAIKAYFKSPGDQRDRMGCEFSAFKFLNSLGFDTVPASLAIDAENRIAVYSYVRGEPAGNREITEPDIDQAVAFLAALKAVADSTSPSSFQPASEACFSIAAIQQSIAGRLSRLEQASAEHPSLAAFLNDEFNPFREAISRWLTGYCQENSIDPSAPIPAEETTLSPSDFGFHNAIRGERGKLVFLDFEYFGWDDPAKTLADFLLHPGMNMPPALKRRFLPGAIAAFPTIPQLASRLRAVYPLFGLKWCTILLNEFTLEHMARRCFAGGASAASSRASQLEKARLLLATLQDHHRDFPYSI